TIQKPDVTLAEAIEQIDIGGPSMLRSAAKNYESVTVVVDPADYDAVLEDMRDHEGETTLKLRERLAIKAFIKTSDYDRAIGSFLNQEQCTDASFSLSLPLVTRLRYGENPHQTAALYGDFDEHFQKLHGKELSFNNILDISAATNLIAEFSEPTVAILKHTNPCGVGSDPDLREAWEKAFATDKQAPFGGLLAQDKDSGQLVDLATKVVTKREPTKEELAAMIFGWRVVKHVKSNAIVYAAADRTLGIGAGQMSRVDASRIAVWKANEAGLSLKGSAVASDAFFPFPDGLIAAAEAGATCAIQPGGSVRDEEVIAAANERKMAMIFTGV